MKGYPAMNLKKYTVNNVRVPRLSDLSRKADMSV
jgi:hypothetical protein